MTGTLIVGILAAVIALVLMRFAAKQPWVISVLAAVVVLVAINIDWIKPALEGVGTPSRAGLIQSMWWCWSPSTSTGSSPPWRAWARPPGRA